MVVANYNGNVILAEDGVHLELIMKYMEKITIQMKKFIEVFVRHLVVNLLLTISMNYF